MRYDDTTLAEGKAANKASFQRKMGLREDPNAPIFFWPSRLDPIQKGPQLLTDILYRVVQKHRDKNLQIAVVANGPHQRHFHDVVNRHDLYGRVAVCDFDESLSRRGYAASDFILMPSLFEPCGLPQMIGPIYGSLPVAHDTGGLHDTVFPLDETANTGNGFLFNVFDSSGLLWGIDRAMDFWAQPVEKRNAQISRVMRESKARFNHGVCAQAYIDIYETMLNRALVK